MKKRILLIALMVILFACTLAILVSAKDINTGYFNLNGNEIIVPTYDEDGDALVWVRSTMLDRAEANGIELANGKNYYETSYEGTTYYIFGIKTKNAVSVDKNYAVSFKSGIGINNNLIVMNLDGIAHSDGTGIQYFGFLMRNNILKYVYFPSSIKSTRALSTNSSINNKQVFLGDANLSQVEFAPGSQITVLDNSAFQSCAITEIVLPEGLTYIGEKAFDACTSLKKIYIPRTVTFIDEIAFNGVTDAEYYFTGVEETTSGWEITDEIQYVNHCDLYYAGNHQTGESNCIRCGKIIYCENPEHNLEINITYENYIKNGVKTVKCLDCNSQNIEKSVSPLFTCYGYSGPVDGREEIVISFEVNKTAILEYEKANSEISYGVFAVSKAMLGDKDIFDEAGKVVDGAITVDINKKYVSFDFRITGFETAEHKALQIAIGAYVAEGSEESSEYSYIQLGTPSENEKYSFASYDSIISASKEDSTETV